MEPADVARLEARLARETTQRALARYRDALEQVADVSERLRVSSYAIRVSLDLLYEVEAHGQAFSFQPEPFYARQSPLADETFAKLNRLLKGN